MLQTGRGPTRDIHIRCYLCYTLSRRFGRLRSLEDDNLSLVGLSSLHLLHHLLKILERPKVYLGDNIVLHREIDSLLHPLRDAG